MAADVPSDLESLERALADDPQRADLRYLLGAELASAGQFERAVAEMTRAVELEPSLHTARLQLGLLHLTSARPREAIETWRPLDSLEDQDPLRLFKRGLEALIVDDFARCIELLEDGIRTNTANPPLNRDMAMVIDRVRAATASAATPAENAEPVHTDFSLYGKKH